MEQLVNQSLTVIVAVGATFLGLLLVEPLKPMRRKLTWARIAAAIWLWAYSFAILFLQAIRPPFAQTWALLAAAGVFWLLDRVIYEDQIGHRATDLRNDI